MVDSLAGLGSVSVKTLSKSFGILWGCLAKKDKVVSE